MTFKKSRWYKRGLWAGAAFLAYVLTGFFVLPPIIKSQLLKRLPIITKRHAAVRQVKFNPLALSLTIRGLSLTEPEGQVFASWEELYVNFQLSSIFRLAWTFADIGLKQPYGHVALFRDGQFNFSNMFEDSAPPPPQPAKPAVVPKINVWRFHVDDGVMVVDDHTHRLPLHTEFKPINISLTNLTTRLGKDSIYSLRASSDSGRSFAWAGTLVVQPFQSHGHFDLEGGELSKYTPILRDFLRAEIADGRLNVRADYAVSAGTNGFDAGLTNCSIEVISFRLKDLNTGEMVSTVPSLTVGPLNLSLRQQVVHVAQVRIAGYTQVIRMEKDGSVNLLKLLDLPRLEPDTTNAGPAAPASPWRISVDDLAISEAAVTFTDQTRRNEFATTLKPIDVHLRGFTTRPEVDATYDFAVTTETAEKFSGDGNFCLWPLRSSGDVKLVGLAIPKYEPYYEDYLHAKVASGKLDAGASYRFAATSNAPTVTVSNAGVALSDFQLKTADTGELVVSIPSFAVEQTDASLGQRKAEVGLVKASGGSIVVRQDKDGRINLLSLLKPLPRNAASSRDSEPAEPPWTAMLKEITFNDYAIKLEDQKPAKPVTLNIDHMGFNAKGVSTISNQPIAVSTVLRLNETGAAMAKGTFKLSPPRADLELSVSDIDLRPFQPYLNEQVRLGIDSGSLRTRGRVRYSWGGPGAPLLLFSGDVGITNLAATDLTLLRNLVKWDDFSVSGIDLSMQPNQLEMQEVRWRGLRTSVIIGQDGRPNLQTLIPEKSTNYITNTTDTNPTSNRSGPVVAKAPTNSAPFPIQLGALVLDNLAFHFADESIEPHCSFDVQELSGSIQGLSSERQSTATVDLKGKVDAGSPFVISGKVNPLANELQLSLGVAFTNTDLTAFSTYLEKYAGYPLNKGRLSMGLHYDIQQKQLKAQNKFLIDRFTLGARNGSTNATSLPVKLAVALLKDRNGQINLDVPLSGRIDDPEFRIAPLIFKVIVNLMVKAATSPFSLLGALVGGGEELSFVEFEPGQAVIPPAEAKKMDKLVKALEQRPGLNLEITGGFDREKDGAALARGKLEGYLHILRLKELADAGKEISDPESLQLEPAERERLLRQVLADLGTNNTLVLQVAPVVTTNMPLEASPARQALDVSAASAAARLARPAPASESKGARDLLWGAPKSARAAAKSAAQKRPPTPDGAPLTTEQVEAKLLSGIGVSPEEQRSLIKQRAQAVQAYILQTGQVAPERLFLATPKTVPTSTKGESRANLSLE